jgi:hypothetical protein
MAESALSENVRALKPSLTVAASDRFGIQGHVTRGFEAVREAFADNLCSTTRVGRSLLRLCQRREGHRPLGRRSKQADGRALVSVPGFDRLCWDTMPFRVTRLSCASLIEFRAWFFKSRSARSTRRSECVHIGMARNAVSVGHLTCGGPEPGDPTAAWRTPLWPV